MNIHLYNVYIVYNVYAFFKKKIYKSIKVC